MHLHPDQSLLRNKSAVVNSKIVQHFSTSYGTDLPQWLVANLLDSVEDDFFSFSLRIPENAVRVSKPLNFGDVLTWNKNNEAWFKLKRSDNIEHNLHRIFSNFFIERV